MAPPDRSDRAGALPLLALLVLAALILLAVMGAARREGFADLRAAPEGFRVVAGREDSAAAEARLREVDRRLLAVLAHLKRKYAANAPGRACGGPACTPAARAVVAAVLRRYDTAVVREEDPRESRETAFTVNKGDALHVCLRRRDTGALHDADLLTFVMLHELAHIGTPSWGHERDFWEAFRFLLAEAQEAGVYAPRDYARAPDVYCGVPVQSNPLFEAGLRDIRVE